MASTSLSAPVVAQAQPAAGNNWTTSAGTVEGTRYSSLAQINTANVARLTQEFEFKTGIEAGHEGAPLVVGNTMYMVGPFPNKLFALNLANRGALRWVFNPRANPFAEGKACCDIVNRGAAYATHPAHPDGLIIYAVLDTTVVAVNAKTGREVWRRKVGKVEIGETMTVAPLVVGDKVIVGNSGGEFGVRGFTLGLNVADGTVAWKAFNTGPDAEVLIQDEFRPFYPKDQGTNLGATTWPGNQWQIGGGTSWMGFTYDPHTQPARSTARPIRGRGTMRRGRATTNGPQRSSRAGRARARRSGRTRSRRTTRTTMTGRTKTSSSTFRSTE